MEIDLVKVNHILVQCLKVVVGSRRLLGEVGIVVPGLVGLERDLRDQAAEIQLFIVERREDGPLALTEGEKTGVSAEGKSKGIANS